jgi:hypothetical protein
MIKDRNLLCVEKTITVPQVQMPPHLTEELNITNESISMVSGQSILYIFPGLKNLGFFIVVFLLSVSKLSALNFPLLALFLLPCQLLRAGFGGLGFRDIA